LLIITNNETTMNIKELTTQTEDYFNGEIVTNENRVGCKIPSEKVDWDSFVQCTPWRDPPQWKLTKKQYD